MDVSGTKMTLFRLARRGLTFFKGYQAALFAGTALSAMVLTGSLLVGDSVTRSLNLYAEQRLGRIEHAISLPRRFVAQELADDLSDQAGQEIAGVLRLRGSVFGGSRAEVGLAVNVLGTDEAFWQVAGMEASEIGRTSVLINERVSRLTGLHAGDVLSLTVEKPSLLSRDIPLSQRGTDEQGTVSLKVTAVLGDDEMGKFSLRAEQIPALNIFVDRGRLQEVSGLLGRINMVLGGAIETKKLQEAVKKAWKLEYSGYSLKPAEAGNYATLQSDRIFIEPAVAETAAAAGGEGTTAYLVNGITSVQDTNRNTPYSFVLSGAPAPFIPKGMSADEAVINSWLADELGLDEGDSIRVSYFRLQGANDLVEHTREFRVRDVLAMDKAVPAREMMPDFPGLSDVESCGDWDIGMPLDKDKVTDEKNEAYWEEYRDTPKLFISLGAGVEMWGNHFGDVTSFRFPVMQGMEGSGARERLESVIDPMRLGLRFRPVAEEAAQAVKEAMDFGGLFISLSFFLILAAVLITGLIYSFAVVKRSRELGVLRAVGFSARRAGGAFLLEAATVSVPGALAGSLLGVAYTKAFLSLINRFWTGAVAGSIVVFHADPGSIFTGVVATALLVMMTVLYSVRRLVKKHTVELVSGRASEDPGRRKSGRRWLGLGLLCGIGAVAVVILLRDGRQELNAFFGAGALALAAGLSVGKFWIDRLGSGAALSVRYVGLRNAARRHERSMAIVVLMALGCFMVFSVACMKEDPTAHAREKWSGTGGFDLIVEFAIPIQNDMLTREGLGKLGFRQEAAIYRSMLVPLKVRDGDDASCLNLNRARVPVVIGVDAGLMARLGAFGPMERSIRAWNSLTAGEGDAVPVIAGDNETVMWGLGMKPGELLELTDEQGVAFQAKLAGSLPVRRSVLQGRLLMALPEFVRRYPSQDGYNMLLLDCPDGWEEITGRAIEKRFRKYGPTLTTGTERLDQLFAVENTYMGMFAALGGLGLLVGALGVGIVATLNILQRRSELALLRAVGYRRVRAGVVIFSEYAFLFVYGVMVGVISAIIAVWPNVRAMGVDLPFGLLAAILAGTLAAGLFSILFAGWASLKGSLVDALRSE